MISTRLLRLAVAALLLLALLLPGAAALAANDGSTDPEGMRLMNWAVTGPMGGDVRSLVIDPQDPSRIYFGTIDGQIYASSDGGASWSRLEGFNRPGLLIDNILIDAEDSRIIYAAAHRHKQSGGFFKSTDGGRTWREVEQLKNEAIHSLRQSPLNPDTLLIGTNNGIYRSETAGESWEKLPTTGMTNVNIESIAIDPRDDRAIYAGSWHLPFKSTDGGQTWQVTNKGIIDDSDVFAIEIDERNPDHVIASACSGIYETKNAGASWRKVNGIPSQSRRTRAILQNPARPNVIYAGTTEGFWMSPDGGDSWKVTTNRQSFEVNAIAVHPKNPDTVYIGTNNYGVMISRDGGRNFAPSNEGYSGRRAYSILPDREVPGRVYATTINTATGGGYFYVSTDGGVTWQLSARNMPQRLIGYSILQDTVDANVIYLGTNYGLYRSADRGASWTPMGAPKPKKPAPKARGRRRRGAAAAATEEVAAAPAPARPTPNETVKRAQEALNLAGFEVGTPDGIAGSRTVGALRKFQAAKGVPVSGQLDAATLIALGLAGGMQEAGPLADAMQNAPVYLTDTINALAHTGDEQDGKPGMLAATNAGLFRTYDLAKGWERLPYGQGFDTRTLCVLVAAKDPEVIYVGTSNSGVLVTRDGGKSWVQLRGIPTDAPVNVIEQDPERAHLYVGTTQTLYISHDGGQRWLRRGGGLPLGSFTSVLINPENPDEIFAGNAYERGGRVFTPAEGGGVFRSTDAGMTWQRLDPPLPSRRVWALAFDPRDPGKIFVGSHSAGVFVARREAGGAASK
ncbi:MAG TPA: peptidoglycan-binding protein [Pyrinomonadaceae bacterium]|nr:peptidoglycan-binding protein [Pyrinomonadaceae bacterium]